MDLECKNTCSLIGDFISHCKRAYFSGLLSIENKILTDSVFG